MEKTVGGDFYGMGMVFPFTKMQWQELQRQALIYKHFMASVPVPPDLLLPSAAKSFPETPAVFLPYTCGGGGGVADGGVNNVRFGNDADLEPGRCRRTDGKKWRCARDAEPDQKYCERHLNRGRPRSRKPVEQPKTRQRTSTGAIGAGGGIELNLPFQSMESNEEPRCEEWMKSYSENSASKKQWEMINSMIGLKHNADPVMQHYEDSPNLSYTDANEGWRDFFNSDTSPFEGTNVSNYNEPPRTFIDAWSSENCKLPLSTLTLSMSGAEEETANQIPACLSLNYNNIKSQPLNWMKPDSPLGGPLAEVLQSSNVTSHESSPRDSPSRFTSSPSGVLQKALVSLSDSSSSSSSPTFAAASRADFALQWTNLNK